MKTIFKGMVLLLAGASFVACSKDVSFDENAQNEAAVDQKFAEYDAAFVKHFGAIASDQDWGRSLAKGMVTRGSFGGASEPANCGFEVPGDITNAKNGNVANTAQSQIASQGVDINGLKKYKDFTFDYYWIQHFNTAQGLHNTQFELEAYDATAGKWIKIENFDSGKNESVTYFTTNSSSHGTTLMIDMGNSGDPDNDNKLFRWKGSDGYHYDYKFLEFSFKQNKNFSYNFLVLGMRASATSNDWWLFVLKQAVPTDPNNLVVEEGRFLCEDMGEIGDFDFNDVVFDAKRYYNGNIKVTLLAGGGTLPSYVDGVSVQEKLEGTMKNTGVGDDVEAKVIDIEAGKYRSIFDIPVTIDPGINAEKYQLESPVGGIPQKICAPINTHWPKEYTDIKLAYSEFNEWVSKNNPKLWMYVEDNTKTYSIVTSY